jgi:hypothetical protein
MSTPPLPKVRAELRIEFMTSGEVFVHGPIDDKMLCYALLEMARDAVKDHKASAIVPPPAGLKL